MLGVSNFTAIVIVIMLLLAISLGYVLCGGMKAIAVSDTVFLQYLSAAQLRYPVWTNTPIQKGVPSLAT